jgi:hypothetical protein
MELDNLKELWKDSNKSSIPIDEDKLRQILSTSSNGPIAKMKRNLKLEVISLIIVYGLLLWATSNEVGLIFTTFDFVLLLVTGMVFIVYASIKYKQLKNMECVSCEVKSNLTLQVRSLEKLVKLYFLAGNISVIFVYLIAGAIGYVGTEGERVAFPSTMEILIFLSIGTILVVINYFLGRWYLFTLYGKHIKKLKTIIYEMDEK